MRYWIFVATLIFGWVLPGCGSGAPEVQLVAAPLIVAAGGTNLAPEAVDTVSAGIDLARLGLDRVDAIYELETPAGEPFRFELLTRAAANAGAVRLSVAHAADGGVIPIGGVESLADVGVVPGASGATTRDVWLDASGDGFARVSLRGAIEREQIVAVESQTGVTTQRVLICVRIGAPSAINPDQGATSDYPGLLDEETIYSSDSWRFGLPTVAISGDRTSVVCYEGDRGDPSRFSRFELRLQHDRATGAVTGGASVSSHPDAGHWRDHEVAALFNVLAVAESGANGVTMRLSFDRGATFAQTNVLGDGGADHSSRLVQVAMAADYTLAVVFWRRATGGSELLLVEGKPSAFDGTGSPTAFQFAPPVVLHRQATDVAPVIMGVRYSDGGDLVVGYGFTFWGEVPGDVPLWSSTTQFRCAVRLFGQPSFDTLVEESTIVGRDPSVALVGQGDTLRVLYAYEARDGVRLRVSDDGGRTFGAPMSVGQSGATLPTVLARPQDGSLRVDLLYLGDGEFGQELFLRHWDDFDSSAPADYRLTKSKREQSDNAIGPVPGALPSFAPSGGGFRITQIAWFGYDATLDGDDVVIVLDEEKFDAFTILGAPPFDVALGPLGSAGAPAEDGFTAAEPPPLAPGLTEPVAAPNPDHLHQLRLIRLD